jgi:hypothetical protein
MGERFARRRGRRISRGGTLESGPMIVLQSTQSVVDQARLVTIDDAAIDRWARRVTPDELRPTEHALLALLPGTRAQLANLVLLIDALNFCFWSEEPIRFDWRGKTYHRFEAMFVSIMLAARYEPKWFDPTFWLDVPRAEIEDVLRGKGRLHLMDERERIIRETGQTLLHRFDGQFLNAIDSVNERAWPLAVLLMTNFDSFRDVSRYRGRPVYFMKRAQICALDLSVAFDTHGHPALAGLEELSAFADYRLPQALRHLGILQVAPELAAAIDRDDEIPADSDAEIEIRAATIHSVDRMTRATAVHGKSVPAWQIDWYLWALSHAPEVSANHHRTRTVYY